jgi:3-hydroxy acid dehydrogenase/malonic semialdehyde reductase
VRFRGDRAKAAKLYEGADALTPEDIAETIHWIETDQCAAARAATLA